MTGSRLVIIVCRKSISNLLRVLTGCHANDLLELARHMTLTAEPGLGSRFRQGHTRFDESLSMPDAHTFQISIRRHADFRPEDTQKIVRAERDVLCQRLQGNALRKMFLNIMTCLLYGSLLFPDMSF